MESILKDIWCYFKTSDKIVLTLPNLEKFRMFARFYTLFIPSVQVWVLSLCFLLLSLFFLSIANHRLPYVPITYLRRAAQPLPASLHWSSTHLSVMYPLLIMTMRSLFLCHQRINWNSNAKIILSQKHSISSACMVWFN